MAGGSFVNPGPKGSATVGSSTRWTNAAIADYRAWIGPELLLQSRVRTEKFDCADLGLAMLARFARMRGLPIVLRRASSKMGLDDAITVISDPFRRPGVLGRGAVECTMMLPTIAEEQFSATAVYDRFEDDARKYIGAGHVEDLGTGNTEEVAHIDDLLPGDLITNGHHVQVVHSVNSTIQAPTVKHGPSGPKRVLEIVQGTLPPVIPQHRAWDLDAARYFDDKGGAWELYSQEDFSAEYGSIWFGRRWNFSRFNAFVDDFCAAERRASSMIPGH
jgi:hypothetical protein